MTARLTYEEAIRKLDDLPSLPAIVVDLINSIDHEDVDISVLAKKVARDLALAAKTLRMANSSLYGLQVKVTTIQQAITYLGFQVTRNLIMAAAVTSHFPETTCQGFDTTLFWRHSIATAACAKVLARLMRVNQDYSFTAGLLHDIGRLALALCFPQEFQHVIAYRAAHDCTMQQAERAVLGIDHVEAGLVLAQHWNFSDTLQLAIAGHHNPEAQGASALAAIIHVANAVVHALDLTHAADDLVPRVSPVAWATIGLDEHACLQLFRETELYYEEIVASILP
jgi:putative nucleotidyltransferase with HDIG domain